MLQQFFASRNPRMYRHGSSPIGFSRQDIARSVSYQRNNRALFNPTLPLRVPDRQTRQASPISSHLRERAEPEIAFQSTALHLAPADSRQIARHQNKRDTVAV